MHFLTRRFVVSLYEKSNVPIESYMNFENKFVEETLPATIPCFLLLFVIAYRSFFSVDRRSGPIVIGQRDNLSMFVPEQEPLQNISESRKILHWRFRKSVHISWDVSSIFLL